MTTIIIFFILHWYLSLFFQTFFLHRYGAHKMYSLSPTGEKVMYILNFLCSGSSYLSPRAYAILHRMHHAYSDTEKDPHSPHFFKDVVSMMVKTRVIYNRLYSRAQKPEKQFENNLPDWDKFDKFADSVPSRLGWAFLYILFYVYFAPYWWLYLLLPIHFLMGPVHGAIVNWCGHKYGYQNFDNQDKSRNTLVFDFLMLGELFQNNHHKFPLSPNFAKKWWEIDPVYPVFKLFTWLGFIKPAKF